MRRLFALTAVMVNLGFSPLPADPWGKDADLVGFDPDCIPYCEAPRGNIVAEIVIGFHQQVLSPADGPRSHFRPSSSQYALDAIRKYGPFQGFAMGCDRLMRENDELWVYRIGYLSDGSPIKLDPVR